MRALVFDFGGTLDTDGMHWSEKFYDAYQTAGLDIAKDAFERAYGEAEPGMGEGLLAAEDGLRRTLRLQVEFQMSVLTDRGLLARADSREALAHQIADRCYEDVRLNVQRLIPLLRDWSGRVSLGIVSNFYGNLAAVCRELKIAPFFSAIIDSACVGLKKPDPAIFRLACDALRVPPGETVVVGDSYSRDIVPSKSVGCATVWLKGRSWETPADISDADFVIHSVHELQAELFERVLR
ncbi:MAG TPA: HAD family hydrolase [Bacteroidota bacterium]|nr:HAD family hydrolase [Bacteroidota bacterium]